MIFLAGCRGTVVPCSHLEHRDGPEIIDYTE